jgi:hypothetical protein
MAHSIGLRWLAASAAALAATALHGSDAGAQHLDCSYRGETGVHSPGMKYTGMVLTSVGGIGLGLGSAVFLSPGGSGDLSGLAAMVVGGAILVPSSVLVHVGVPLWAVGASEPECGSASAIPEVGVGASGGTLRWSF